MTKKKVVSYKNKKEIFWNLINSIIAGVLVFLGAFIDGQITQKELVAALSASLIFTFIKFQEYWNKEKKEYCKNIINFI